jgi:hypothetical protein
MSILDLICWPSVNWHHIPQIARLLFIERQ